MVYPISSLVKNEKKSESRNKKTSNNEMKYWTFSIRLLSTIRHRVGCQRLAGSSNSIPFKNVIYTTRCPGGVEKMEKYC